MRNVGENAWVVESGGAAYALAVRDGHLLQTYWGERLPLASDYVALPPPRIFPAESPLHREPFAIATGEGGVFLEHTLDLVGSTGIRGAQLRFERTVSDGTGLAIHLSDKAQQIAVTLHVRELGNGLFAQHLSLRNTGTARLHLERALSGSFHLPTRDTYTLQHLAGRWGDEFRKERHPMAPGVLVRESRRIIPSHGGEPYFAVDEGNVTEEAG